MAKLGLTVERQKEILLQEKPTQYDLDALLNHHGDISDTKISSTKRAEVSSTKISSTKGQYMNQYKREHKDTLRIDLAKGQKEVLKREAASRGISVTKMIEVALEMYLSATNV